MNCRNVFEDRIRELENQLAKAEQEICDFQEAGQVLDASNEVLRATLAEARKLFEWAQDKFIGPKVWQKSVNDWLEKTQ